MSVAKCAAIGAFVTGPGLHGWYKMLEWALPGTTPGLVTTKVLLDALIAGLPFYGMFLMSKFRRLLFDVWLHRGLMVLRILSDRF